MKRCLMMSYLGSICSLLLTSCGASDFVFTGSASSASPIQLLFLQTKSAEFSLTMIALTARDNGPNSPLNFDPKISLSFPLSNQEGKRPILLDSSIQGNQVYLTRQDRIQVISRETLNTTKDGQSIIIDPTRDLEWIANLGLSTNCLFQSSQVSSDNRWISALVQCGSPSDPAGSQIWIYSLEQQKEWLRLPNPTPINQPIDTYSKDLFNKKGFPYVISGNTLYFTKPNSTDQTRSDLYYLDLNSSVLIIPFNFKPTLLEGVYSLGIVDNSAVALTASGVKNFILPTNELSAPLPSLGNPTQLWSNVNHSGFWDVGTDSTADRRIHFKNIQSNNTSNIPLGLVKDITFSNDDYAWVLTSTSLLRFDVGILNPNSPLGATSIDYNQSFLFQNVGNPTTPFAVAWLLGSTQP